LFPAKLSERAQLTVWDATEHDHPPPLALVGVTPIGNVSLTVTVPLLAPNGLMFSTGTV
jgi:hypothetical protein